jgi:hypothetical protein
MRTWVALLTALVVLVAATPSSAARDRCAARGAKTVKQTSAVRVYRQTRGDASIYYACLRSSGRRLRVANIVVDAGDDLSSGSVRPVLIRGTHVAVVESSFSDIGPDGSEDAALTVADLRPHGRVYRVAISANPEDQYEGFARVILRADGAAAWVLAGQREYDEVDVLGPTAKRPTPVAYAKGIDQDSLAFGGEGVTWVQAGTQRTAAIP